MKRGVRVAVVLVRFIIIVQGEVDGFQWRAEWNTTVSAKNFRISAETPDPRIPSRIPTEVVISHRSETVIMWFLYRPSLTRDSSSRGVCFSRIVTA